MYSREVEGSERSFGVSGKLWHGVLVMYDRETESFWTQLDGRSIQGPEHGKALEHYPSVFTTWASWKAAHPNTLVLDKAEDEKLQAASNYADYFSDPERLFLSRNSLHRRRRSVFLAAASTALLVPVSLHITLGVERVIHSIAPSY